MNKFTYIGFTILITSILVWSYLHSQGSILHNPNISWGVGWNNNVSMYAGSEVNFTVEHSNTVTIEVQKNSKADQGIDVRIDRKQIDTHQVNDDRQILTYKIDPTLPHTISIRHFCTYLLYPCSITLHNIAIDRTASVGKPFTHSKPVLSILGDSISTMYGNQNYAFLLSDTLNFELHNASTMGSSITLIENADSASLRYEKDLKQTESEYTIIFLGTNDAKHSVDQEIFYQTYSHLVEQILKWYPSQSVLLVGILPRKDLDQRIVDSYNATISKIAAEQRIDYIDTSHWLTSEDFGDDIHPSIEGQKKIYSKLLEYYQIKVKNL